MWRWRRRNADREQVLAAILAQVALLHEVIVQHLGHPPPAATSGPVPPLLLAALAAPSRDGDLLRLNVSGHDFLVVTGAGTAEPEAVWAQAAAVAQACAVAPLTAGGHEVVHLGYRAFPDSLRAVGVCNAHGDLLAWVSAFLTPAEQRAALRRLVRADPGGGNILPLAAPFALLLRHPVRAALGSAAAISGTVAAITGTAVPAHHPPPVVAVPGQNPTPAWVPRVPVGPAHRRSAHHGHQLRGSLGTGARHLPPPRARPVPAPSLSPSALPPPPLSAHRGHTCIRVLGIRVCAGL